MPKMPPQEAPSKFAFKAVQTSKYPLYFSVPGPRVAVAPALQPQAGFGRGPSASEKPGTEVEAVGQASQGQKQANPAEDGDEFQDLEFST
jgi:hypothetical protein